MLLVAIGLALAPAASVSGGPDVDAVVREAIVAAVQARMGTEADVEIDALRLPAAWRHDEALARLVPGARLGRPLRVSLGVASARPGGAIAWSATAEADVRVLVPHLHARRAVVRGDTVLETDVDVVRHAVDGALRAWPAPDAAGRSRALRDLPAGACLSPGTVALLPMVRAGQELRAIVRVGVVVAEATVIAADNGEMGALVRVINPLSRRALKARVTGPGEVEVIP